MVTTQHMQLPVDLDEMAALADSHMPMVQPDEDFFLKDFMDVQAKSTIGGNFTKPQPFCFKPSNQVNVVPHDATMYGVLPLKEEDTLSHLEHNNFGNINIDHLYDFSHDSDETESSSESEENVLLGNLTDPTFVNPEFYADNFVVANQPEFDLNDGLNTYMTPAPVSFEASSPTITPKSANTNRTRRKPKAPTPKTTSTRVTKTRATSGRRQRSTNSAKPLKKRTSSLKSTSAGNKSSGVSLLNQSSAFRGVSCCGRDRKWQARIRDRKQNRVKYLGRFVSQLEAALEYDRFARTSKGPNALTNFVELSEKDSEILSEAYAKHGYVPEELFHLLGEGMESRMIIGKQQYEAMKSNADTSTDTTQSKPTKKRKRSPPSINQPCGKKSFVTSAINQDRLSTIRAT